MKIQLNDENLKNSESDFEIQFQLMFSNMEYILSFPDTVIPTNMLRIHIIPKKRIFH